LIPNFRQRITSRRTNNANDLGTYALPGLCRFRICVRQTVRETSLSVTKKQTCSLTYRYSALYINTCDRKCLYKPF